ncbi:SRPBCC family protein [Nocardiopsis terrae]
MSEVIEAEITEQIPGERVARRSTDGVSHAGVVTFHHITDTRTRITLQLEVVPEGVVEQLGDKLGLVEARAKGDMKRFRSFAENPRVTAQAPRPSGRLRGRPLSPEHEPCAGETCAYAATARAPRGGAGRTVRGPHVSGRGTSRPANHTVALR